MKITITIEPPYHQLPGPTTDIPSQREGREERHPRVYCVVRRKRNNHVEEVFWG